MKRILATLTATALAGGMLFAGAPAADANVHKRIKVAGRFGHVVAYDFYWKNWSMHERHKSVWPGHQSPKSWSVDYVVAVGSRCPGVLWWTKPSPDKRLGYDALVSRAHSTFRVSEDC